MSYSQLFADFVSVPPPQITDEKPFYLEKFPALGYCNFCEIIKEAYSGTQYFAPCVRHWNCGCPYPNRPEDNVNLAGPLRRLCVDVLNAAVSGIENATSSTKLRTDLGDVATEYSHERSQPKQACQVNICAQFQVSDDVRQHKSKIKVSRHPGLESKCRGRRCQRPKSNPRKKRPRCRPSFVPRRQPLEVVNYALSLGLRCLCRHTFCLALLARARAHCWKRTKFKLSDFMGSLKRWGKGYGGTG
jgi:hypothetical protein